MTAPADRLVDFSGSSGRPPSRLATGLIDGKVPVWIGLPFWMTVAIEVKYCCCSAGARNPVEAVPRSANQRVKS